MHNSTIICIFWIDLGEFAYGVPEWDLALLWTMCHNMPDDRVQHIFHITHEQK